MTIGSEAGKQKQGVWASLCEIHESRHKYRMESPVASKGTWGLGEDGQLRVIQRGHEQLQIHIEYIFCTITKRKLENAY